MLLSPIGTKYKKCSGQVWRARSAELKRSGHYLFDFWLDLAEFGVRGLSYERMTEFFEIFCRKTPLAYSIALCFLLSLAKALHIS